MAVLLGGRSAAGSNGGGFDEDIHLLADVHRELVTVEAVQDLQDAGVDTLCAITGQRLLRHDEGLKTDELQRGLQPSVAAHKGKGRSAAAYTPRVVLVDIDTDVQLVYVSE